ncbi:unnamed protein product [Amaranthus hypochondriacus]
MSAQDHEGASSLFMKPFVHFDKLCEIYGKRKPNRKRVRLNPEAIGVPVNHIRNCETQSNVREDANSMTQSTITLPSSETRFEKCKRFSSKDVDPSELGFMEMSKTMKSLAEAQKNLTLTMMNMKKASSYDVEISEHRKKLFSVLMNLPGLSPVEVVKAARSIGQDDKKVQVFFSMPDEYKIIFVHLEIETLE